MPDYEIGDGEIAAALLAKLRQPDEHGPGWSGITAQTITAQLLPVVRKLLDRPRPGYTYRAVVHRWVDADSLELDIDLGKRQWCHEEPVRLKGVNAPDRAPAKGKATAWMRDTAPVGTELIARTYLDEEDRYGRLLADLWLGDLHLNAALIDAGHGMPYAGGKRPDDY